MSLMENAQWLGASGIEFWAYLSAVQWGAGDQIKIYLRCTEKRLAKRSSLEADLGRLLTPLHLDCTWMEWDRTFQILGMLHRWWQHRIRNAGTHHVILAVNMRTGWVILILIKAMFLSPDLPDSIKALEPAPLKVVHTTWQCERIFCRSAL